MELSVVILLKKTTEPFRSWILDHDHVTDHDPGFFIPELVEFELKDVWFPDDSARMARDLSKASFLEPL